MAFAHGYDAVFIFIDFKLVSGVDLNCYKSHILQCTKRKFACFLPRLGREFAHDLFLACMVMKFNLKAY